MKWYKNEHYIFKLIMQEIFYLCRYETFLLAR